jgi:DNA (cytosine-5)-methyltransferase 1
MVHRTNHGTESTINTSVKSLVDFVVVGDADSAKFAYPPEIIESEFVVNDRRFDALLAGPPCQGHSNLNNHTRRDDPRNDLYVCVPAIAIALGIPIVVIENVQAVTHAKSDVVKTTMALLQGAGYEFTEGVIDVSKLGWPQTRKRYFIVATLGRTPIPLKELSIELAHEAKSLRWLIDDLPQVEYSETVDDYMLQLPRLSEENVGRIAFLDQEGEVNLPDHIRPDCHKDGHTYKSSYGRMAWDKPAQTITTGFLTPGRGRFIHPEQSRVITPREAARIQAFPDWYDFTLDGAAPTKAQLTKWIGDAVPAPMGYVAALSALGAI